MLLVFDALRFIWGTRVEAVALLVAVYQASDREVLERFFELIRLPARHFKNRSV
jgi:hypothetical protein